MELNTWTDLEDRVTRLLGRAPPVTDRPLRIREAPPLQDADVLVVKPTPAACAAVVRNLVAARAVVVCTADELDLLPALLAPDARCTVVSDRVLALAACMPVLDDDSLGLLGAVVAGCTYCEIGRTLGVSTASVKRRVAHLARVLGVRGRYAVARRALALGVEA